MNKKQIITVIAVLFVIALGVVTYIGSSVLAGRRQNFNDRYVLHVYPSMTAADVMDTLTKAGVVINTKALQRSFAVEDVAEKIKPGCYVIDKTSTNAYVARMLVFGWQTPQNLTFSGNIRTKERLARLISNQMMVSYKEVLDSLSDADFLARHGTDKTNLFGAILPDTYQMYWTASMGEIMDRMNKEYNAFWNADRQSKAKARGLTQQEVATLASIVSSETNKDFEYPVIAGVYLNRLAIGMKLQADPTVAYCFGFQLKRILLKHLEVDSPYNTYKYAGLPPGPICVPPKACIDAVLNPKGKDYIYFCASSAFDGTHKFASDYKEHQRNAREYQNALNARGLR